MEADLHGIMWNGTGWWHGWGAEESGTMHLGVESWKVVKAKYD